LRNSVSTFQKYYRFKTKKILQTGYNKMAHLSSSSLLSSKRKLIAVCQMTATNNKQENIKTCIDLIKSARNEDCLV